ncbi:membrane protein [Polymorphobacter multimanifer]|uniref:PepSY-associated TM helix domain-containing protein n=1 Tax=Polymorphobacter multimanifer TaxID=1070431 RepID=UPI0019B51631|nr:PepSY-associated TM helix domain-containing protein [Polymorphobacter multimanifer]GGI88955.1 membrane protein [Polymorphobacter multimanifer]
MSGPGGGLRQSQAFLHSWSGLLLGWVLFIVFVAGTLAFYRDGLNRWMRPELARGEQRAPVIAGAQRFLAGRAPDAKNWFITLPNTSTAGAQLFWQPEPVEGQPRRRGRRDNQAIIGADGEPAVVRETRGGEFFYRMHFDLHYLPVIWARWLVGLAAMAMLVAILSGIVTHKKIFKDFFTMRRDRGQRSWLDGHNAVAVLALPFHLMITYTGLVTLMALLMPWAVVANYTDDQALSDVLFPFAEQVERSNTRVPLHDLDRLVEDAERRFGAPAGAVSVDLPGDAAARVTISRAPTSMLSTRTPSLTYDGVSGALVWESPAPGGAAVTAGAMIGLHAGRFADDGLRLVYFLCGVAGSIMVGSGLVLWTVKRRARLPDPARPYFGFRLVEWLNIGVVGGFPLGIAVLFWANRLLPLGMKGRADWEIHVMFMAWAAVLLVAALRSPKRAWTITLGLTGALLAALPAYNMIATDRGIGAALGQGDHLLAGIDAMMLVFGLAYLVGARRVGGHRAQPTRVRDKAHRSPAALEAAE